MRIFKYLCYFSYNGKYFSGTQLQKHETNNPTVHSCLKVIKLFNLGGIRDNV